MWRLSECFTRLGLRFLTAVLRAAFLALTIVRPPLDYRGLRSWTTRAAPVGGRGGSNHLRGYEKSTARNKVVRAQSGRPLTSGTASGTITSRAAAALTRK